MVVSKVPGRVKQIFFKVGDTVKEDDILFSVDDKDIQDSIKSLELQLKSSQIAVDMAQKALASSKGSMLEQQLTQAETSLKTSELQYNNAKKSYEDSKILYEAGSASKQQYDQAKTAFEAAEISFNAAQQAYDLLINKTSQENIDRAKDQLNQAIATKENVEFQLKKAKENLAETDVKSPISGVISSRTIEEGEMVGSTSVPFIVVQIDPVVLAVNISEQMLGSIKEGDYVNVVIGAIKDKTFTGKIRSIAPVADERTATYPVEIEIENKDNELKAGMFGEVNFITNKQEDVIVVKRETLIEKDNKTFVFTITEDNKAKLIEVETGIDNGKEVEITKGLNVGQSIIVKGQDYLIDGDNIKISAE
jgi:RND family efflux transporter MFP subunit